MAPIITQWSDLDSVYEASDANTGKFLYTTFSVIDDNDAFYFGQLIVRKLKITLEEFTAALELIPDEDLFPEFPLDAHLTLAPNELDVDAFYIKRPRLRKYEEYKEDGDLSTIPTLVLDEAHALQIVSQQPHPGIIGYHGCRVRRGRITGLVLDKHPHNLKEYIKNGIGEIDDKEAFMNALEAAVRYLHSLGLAHNDINPANILVNAARMPVLVDFGSCREIGHELGISRGTMGWIEGDIRDYNLSEERHDWFAVEKIRAWLEKPNFDW